MCDPVSIVMGVVAIASTAYTLNQQEIAAERQEKASRKAADVRETELAMQAGQAAQERSQRARAERARLRAASAESGLVGLSIDEALNNVDFQLGTNQALGALNLQNATQGNRAGLNSNLAQIQTPDAAGAYLNTGLQIYGQNQTSINNYFKPETPAAPTGG